WGSIQITFADRPGSLLDKLTAIQSTGSDFHKGGQQVLILTFSIQGATRTLHVVYKPSDLEVDCLIVGDTQAVNILRPRFQQSSLMEMLNSLIQGRQDLGLYAFPTYKILPLSPGSLLSPDHDGTLPIRNSYGYIQFLEYDGRIKLSVNEQAVCEHF